MTNKERLIANNEKIEQIQETLKNKILSATDDTALKILNNTLERFDNNEYGLTKLRVYQFYDNLDMKYLDLTGIDTLSDYCCRGVKNAETIILDDNLKSIGDYALYIAGKDTDKTFNVKTAEKATIGEYAMRVSNVKKAELDVVSPLGTYAFDSCGKLTDLTIKMHSGTSGAQIDSYAFGHCENVEKFYFDPNISINNVGSYAFVELGINRPNPENNVFVFRPIQVTKLSNGCFFGCCYFDVWASGTTSIGSSFGKSDHCCLYCTGSVPPTLNANAFGSGDSLATNYKIFVPYDNINTYKTATNWVTHADYIFGWAEENTLEQGATLPTTNSEGLTLTWYSDKDMTTQVTTVDDPSKIYYCVGV